MIESGQGASLVHESLESPGEALAVVLGDRMNGEIPLPHRHLDGQVLLHRHLLVEVRIFGQVGDAEPALAENLLDPVPVHHVTGLEGVAVGADSHGIDSCKDAKTSAA